MPRSLRYLLIWISCTAVSVTAVILTVHFVVGSTKPTPPVARSAPTVFSSPSEQARKTKRPSKPSPSATSRAPTRKPSPKPTPARTSHPPSPTPASPSGQPTATQSPANCTEGGSGVQTIQSAGGQATVRFGDNGVCFVSAIPTQGFTVRTSQTEPTTLRVIFSGDRRQSEIMATTEPYDRAEVTETSW
ncbi:hypothetical protein [Streptomyces sp. NPDC051776]|uniref:hypothetical protein n=1 Tax=Streptomyces sp. NPDC051776 TaxID=3155414 RepID=UPI003438B08B